MQWCKPLDVSPIHISALLKKDCNPAELVIFHSLMQQGSTLHALVRAAFKKEHDYIGRAFLMCSVQGRFFLVVLQIDVRFVGQQELHDVNIPKKSGKM